MVKTLQSAARNGSAPTPIEPDRAAQNTKRRPGRPRGALGTGSTLTVKVAALQRALALATSARNTRSPAVRYTMLTDLVSGLEAMVAPALNPPQSGKVIGYRVTLGDGTEQRCATLQQAAELYGAKPASLAAMLSRGGGRCSRKAGDSLVRCARMVRVVGTTLAPLHQSCQTPENATGRENDTAPSTAIPEGAESL